MSSIDDLRYYLASAGYSSERIAEVEQHILQCVIVSGVYVDYVVSAMRAMLEFEVGMKRIETSAGTAMEALQAISAGIEAMADMPTAKPVSKQPYYQKNKQRWWK